MGTTTSMPPHGKKLSPDKRLELIPKLYRPSKWGKKRIRARTSRGKSIIVKMHRRVPKKCSAVRQLCLGCRKRIHPNDKNYSIKRCKKCTRAASTPREPKPLQNKTPRRLAPADDRKSSTVGLLGKLVDRIATSASAEELRKFFVIKVRGRKGGPWNPASSVSTAQSSKRTHADTMSCTGAGARSATNMRLSSTSPATKTKRSLSRSRSSAAEIGNQKPTPARERREKKRRNDNGRFD